MAELKVVSRPAITKQIKRMDEIIKQLSMAALSEGCVVDVFKK